MLEIGAEVQIGKVTEGSKLSVQESNGTRENVGIV